MMYTKEEFTAMLKTAIVETLDNPYFIEPRDFYHENDFQFQLALKLKEKIQPAEIAFEYPMKFPDSNRTQHIDIMVKLDDGQMVPIELKHVSKEKTDNGGFVLYSFINDVIRMEDIFKKEQSVEFSYALFVTNVRNIYDPEGKNRHPAYAPMFLCGTLYGKHNYYWTAEEGTKGGRKTITLAQDHPISWIPAGKRGYRYLLIPVEKEE